MKLSKLDHHNRAQVLAWVRNQQFKSTQRGTAAIPDLTTDEVRERFVPDNIKWWGRFYTPVSMAEQAVSLVPIMPAMKVLDLCAGIGNLAAQIAPGTPVEVDAVEIDSEAVAIGRKLHPGFNWIEGEASSVLAGHEDRYDVVLSNPPFGSTAGMGNARENSIAGFTKSDHLCVELAIRCLKPGGQALFIAQEQLFESMPKSGRNWLAEHVDGIYSSPLQGKFRYTAVSVHAFTFERIRA